MTSMVEKALRSVDESYDSLIGLANDISTSVTKELDELMANAYTDIEKLSNDAIRDLMLKLSLKSYTLSEIKEKSAFKAILGEAIRKEQYAYTFNSSDGTVAARENNAIIQTNAEIMAEELYSLVANMLKAKLEEAHRVVSTLQTILMTRMQEAKLSTVDIG